MPKNWCDLPANVRQKVTNELSAESLSKLAQCSKQCQIDVKSSTSYIDNITLDLEDEVRISVGHRKNMVDYYYVFLDIAPGKVLKKCFSHNDESLLYKNEVESDIVAEVFAIVFWQQLISDCADRVRELRFTGSRVLNWNFAEIDHFGRLESIYSTFELYVENIMPKIRSTLKTVQIENEFTSEAMSDRLAFFEKMYEAEKIVLQKTILTDYQFNRLTANIIEVPVGAITEICLIQFIRKWMRGELRADFKTLCLGWPRHQMFNVVRVLRDIGAVLTLNFKSCRIKQTCSNAKEALIIYTSYYHHFEFGFYVHSE